MIDGLKLPPAGRILSIHQNGEIPEFAGFPSDACCLLW
jgi:hypothetical protein